MPKIECPFVREVVSAGIGSDYVVTPKINPGYEWVFEDPAVRAIEKLHGTNVSIVVEDGQIKSFWNRTERLPFFNKGKKFITEGLLESHERGYCELEDGQWFGELIGPKVNGNPYKLDKHLWIPFKTYAWEKLHYTSWGKYPKTYEALSSWFEKDIFSIFYRKHHQEVKFPEGIVFTHPDGRMAKLRRDMFPWARTVGLHPHKEEPEVT